MTELVLDGAPGLVVLLSFGVIGLSILARLRFGLTPLECLAYGFPLGIVVMSLAMLGGAVALDHLSERLVLICAGGPSSSRAFCGCRALIDSRARLEFALSR